MNRPGLNVLSCVAVGLAAGSCGTEPVAFVGLPLETRFAFTNFSVDHYATIALREAGDANGAYRQVPLLPPGATFRATFLDFLGTGCPDALDLRFWMYRRVNADLPIGLDEGETVEATPVVAGQTLGLPACNVTPLETYTMVNWEAGDGVGRVRIAQNTPVDDEIRDRGLFTGLDGTWELTGVDPDLADDPAPELADVSGLSGSVTLADGTGVQRIGVLVRTRFRVRHDDADTENDPDAGFSDPIAFTTTDENGAFFFNRPAGVYKVEFFSDEFVFRPDFVFVESPIDVIATVAEIVEAKGTR